MATIEPRTGKDGSKSYRVRVRLRGEKPRTQTFKRLTDAKAWAAKAESDLGHGTYVPMTADRRRTLAELITKFRKRFLTARANPISVGSWIGGKRTMAISPWTS